MFTHASWASERTRSYERLEFLGDSVLGVAIAHALYERHPDFEEGRLAKARAHVVSRASCAVVARELGLGERLLARLPEPRPDNADELARNERVLAALLEAVLGALFLEHGLGGIETAIADAFAGRIEYALTASVEYDAKTELMETAGRTGLKVAYVVLEESGPPHDRHFTSAVVVDGEQLGRGEGRTKKAAEQEAAREALARLDVADAT